MSQYLSIYLKADGHYIPIGDYSRSTALYSEFNAPYGKILKYTPEMLREIRARIQLRIESCKNSSNDFEDLISLIPKFEGVSVEDKINAIMDYKSEIDDIKEEISQLQYYDSICCFLAQEAEDYCPVYAGVEVDDVTDEDVIWKKYKITI